MVSSFSVEGPQGLFVVDSTGRIATIKPSIEGATSLPTTFPEEPAWALARGSALTAAAAPRFEASTQGFAYAQDPDDDDFVDSVETATGALLCADEVTRRGFIDVIRWSATDAVDGAERLSGKFISIGSLAASIVVVGAVTVVMALAASTAPTSTQHLVERGQVLPAEPITVGPSAPPPTYKAAAAPNPAPVQNLPPALPPPPPPMTVAVQQAPRAVTSQAPTSTPRAAQPVAAAQAPVSTPKPVAPVVVDPPPETASAPLDLQPVNAPILPPTAELPFPALAPIAPAAQVPQFAAVHARAAGRPDSGHFTGSSVPALATRVPASAAASACGIPNAADPDACTAVDTASSTVGPTRAAVDTAGSTVEPTRAAVDTASSTMDAAGSAGSPVAAITLGLRRFPRRIAARFKRWRVGVADAVIWLTG